MIEVRNLSKYYGSFKAVHDISFSVQEGEIVGFLGPNGAGKTTTIRALTCFHPATSGAATIAGFDVFTQSMEVRRHVGYLPESVPLYTEMRVREYLHFRGKLRGLDRPARQAAIAKAAERCFISDVVHRPIGQLSKGYRQRVGLADALMHNPKVLILDEPTVGLDPTQIRETRSLIRELAADHTVMLSSHILPEVQATCQRIIIINRGTIVASGTQDELRQQVRGAGKLIAELKGPTDAIEPALRKLPGVSEVRCEQQDGWVRAALTTPDDVREQVYRLSTEHGWPLRELSRDVGGLEDYFVKIVTESLATATRKN